MPGPIAYRCLSMWTWRSMFFHLVCDTCYIGQCTEQHQISSSLFVISTRLREKKYCNEIVTIGKQGTPRLWELTSRNQRFLLLYREYSLLQAMGCILVDFLAVFTKYLTWNKLLEERFTTSHRLKGRRTWWQESHCLVCSRIRKMKPDAQLSFSHFLYYLFVCSFFLYWVQNFNPYDDD